MRSVSNQCLLMQIQPTILRFAKMLASVLQLEVEIVDADMVRVAGTGPMASSSDVSWRGIPACCAM